MQTDEQRRSEIPKDAAHVLAGPVGLEALFQFVALCLEVLAGALEKPLRQGTINAGERLVAGAPGEPPIRTGIGRRLAYPRRLLVALNRRFGVFRWCSDRPLSYRLNGLAWCPDRPFPPRDLLLGACLLGL